MSNDNEKPTPDRQQLTDSSEERTLSRRQLLAILGSGTAVAAGGAFLATRPDDSDSVQQTPDQGVRVPPDAENIEDHGAVPNPEDPDSESAETNLNAFKSAARSAGQGGTVYVPDGTYFMGHGGDGPNQYMVFGKDEPTGISIIGAGPEVSTLGVTGHAPADEIDNQSGFVWDDGASHGTVHIKNIKLDGNYENLPNLDAEGGGSVGLNVDGEGDVHLLNAHIRGWYMNGIRGRHLLRSVQRCTFEENGIALHNDSDGTANAHHISARPRNGNECRIQNCHFIDCAGNALNVNDNDGTVRMFNCYATGTGSGLCKLSAGRLVEFRHIYHEANTKSIEEKVEGRDDRVNLHGLNFINSLGERGNVSVNLETYHVESRNITDYALQSRGTIGEGPTNLRWRGDMVALHNTNLSLEGFAIRSRAGGTFDDVEIDRLSVHDSGGVFSLEQASGQINTLHRAQNDPLGETSQLRVNEDVRGGDPFQPDVPSPEEVGINSHTI